MTTHVVSAEKYVARYAYARNGNLDSMGRGTPEYRWRTIVDGRRIGSMSRTKREAIALGNDYIRIDLRETSWAS